jgi:hypothetical protein
VAKRKRRRPNAGPPPIKNPRREDGTARAVATRPKKTSATARGGSRGGRRQPARGRNARPDTTSLRGIITRAAIVAVLFFPYLVYIAMVSAGAALITSVIAFILMIPFGWAFDRLLYRIRLRRWERRQAGG